MRYVFKYYPPEYRGNACVIGIYAHNYKQALVRAKMELMRCGHSEYISTLVRVDQ